MMNLWAFSTMLFLTQGIQVMPPPPPLNYRPMIGIAAQRAPGGSPGDTYIFAEYVKLLETGGARVVPVFAGRSEEYYINLFNKLNGVLLPAGYLNVNDSLYAHTGNILYNYTLEVNSKGDYFPIWGACLGLQFLVTVTAGRNLLKYTDSVNMAVGLDLERDYKKSRLLGSAPDDIISIIGWENVTFHFHNESVLLLDFEADEKLSSFYRVISYNTDRQGVVFVSTIEAFNYPIYGLQWHPESNMFGWDPELEINHSENGMRVAQYMANFFVQEG